MKINGYLKMSFPVKKYILLLLFVYLILQTIVVRANIPQTTQIVSMPVRAYTLMDYNSGKILLSMKGDEHMKPASITKLMTGYIIYKALKDNRINIEDEVTISKKAWMAKGSKMFIKVNTQVSVRELLMGMVVQSGNDATIALAEYLAGSEEAFTMIMNQEAEKLQLRNSNFTNVTGLHNNDHYMSANDIAILAKHIIYNFPEQYKLYSVKSYKFNNIEQTNRNKLLFIDQSVDGIKTGHTESAGYCLVSSAKRGDTRLISVVLGANNERDRFSVTQELLNYGFNHFESYKIKDSNITILNERVWKGQENSIPLGLAEPLYIQLNKGQDKNFSFKTLINNNIVAPIKKQQILGELIVNDNEKEVCRANLVALKNIDESNWLMKIIDSIVMFFYYIF